MGRMAKGPFTKRFRVDVPHQLLNIDGPLVALFMKICIDNVVGDDERNNALIKDVIEDMDLDEGVASLMIDTTLRLICHTGIYDDILQIPGHVISTCSVSGSFAELSLEWHT